MYYRLQSAAVTVCAAVAGCFMVSACAGPSTTFDRAQSRYTFPNSNIKPIGHVSAEATKYTLLTPSISDPDMEEEVLRTAITQRGGDMLIDAEYYWNSFGYLIYWNKVHVDGQAAMIDLGLQDVSKPVPDKR
jgi:hypothetical protein